MMIWRVLILSAALAPAAFVVSAQETVTYTYDVHGRLISVSRTSGATTAYTYDGGDSRTSRVTTGGTSLLMDGEDGQVETPDGVLQDPDLEDVEAEEAQPQSE